MRRIIINTLNKLGHQDVQEAGSRRAPGRFQVARQIVASSLALPLVEPALLQVSLSLARACS
jgi:hypothetical protein